MGVIVRGSVRWMGGWRGLVSLFWGFEEWAGIPEYGGYWIK